MNDERAYNYMDLEPGQKPADIELGYIFYWFMYQCSTSATYNWLLGLSKGRKLLPNLTAIVVPGSRPVKRAAEKLGLDKVF